MYGDDPGQLSLAIPPRVGKMSTAAMITAIAREETASSA